MGIQNVNKGSYLHNQTPQRRHMLTFPSERLVIPERGVTSQSPPKLLLTPNWPKCLFYNSLCTCLTCGRLNEGISGALCQFLCVNELRDRVGIMARYLDVKGECSDVSVSNAL